MVRVAPIRPLKGRESVAPHDAGLVLDHVTHAYGDNVVVSDVNLSIGPGELLCLLGPSGCGKTTTLRIAAGLEEPLEGRVMVGGRVVSGEGPSVPPERRGVGFLFQDYALFPHLSVMKNVTFGIREGTATQQRTLAVEALERVGMADYAEVYPHTLSGGQQQRVALARALAPRPRLMLLDEPFSGLDKRLRDQVRDETLHILKDSGVSTLMVTHDPEEAMFMADAIALMREGRIVQHGSPVELYCRPNCAFAARFFSEVNAITARVSNGIANTVLGAIDAAGMADGTEAEVLVRPEALKLKSVADRDEPAVWATVMQSRMLGRTSLVHLRIEAKHERSGALHLHARIPGAFLPPEGEVLEVVLDRDQVFVYPLVVSE